MFNIRQVFLCRNRQSRCGPLAVLTLAALPLSADTVIVSNFSSSNPTYDTSTGDAWATGGAGDSGNAVGFQSSFSFSYVLSQIQVADSFASASTDGGIYDELYIGIWQSTSNDLNAATELQSWTIGPTGLAPVDPQVFTLTSASTTIINPTDFYFITETILPDTASPGANNAEWGWETNNLTPPETGYYSIFPGGGWFAETGTTPVFGVTGSPVVSSATPEPRSYALLLGAGLLCLLILRRQAATRVTGGSTEQSATPVN